MTISKKNKYEVNSLGETLPPKNTLKSRLEYLEETIIVILLVSINLLVFSDVIMRFVFNTGVLWMDELVLHLSAWFVLFGASFGLRVGSHIGVNVIVKKFSLPYQRGMTIVGICLSLVYCYLIAYGSYVYIQKIYSINIELEDLPIPKYLVLSILVISMFLLAWRLIDLLISVIKGEEDGFIQPSNERDAMLESEILETK